MKKSYKVMSTAALAAVFASSAIIAPVVASADTTAQAEFNIESVYFNVDGAVYQVSLTDYAAALVFGNAELDELIGANPIIESILVNGKVVSLEDYAELLVFGGELADLPTVDYSDVNDVVVNEDGTIDVTPPTNDVDFKVLSIAQVDVTSITVELDATPSEAPTAADFSVTVGGVAVEVTDVTEGAEENTFVLSVDLFDQAGELIVNGTVAEEAVDFAVTPEQIQAAIDAVNVDGISAEELLTALNNRVLGLEGVNADNIGDYLADITANVTTTVERIQAAIDRVNAAAEKAETGFITALNAALSIADMTAALDGLEIENVSTADTVQLAYFDAIQATKPSTKKAVQDLINDTNLSEAIKAVNTAKTEEAFLAALKAEILEIEDIVDLNAGAYFEAKDANLVDAEAIQAFVTAVNAKEVSDADAAALEVAVKAVNEATTEATLLAALKAEALNLTDVADANATAYATAKGDKTFKNTTAIQTFVNTVNAAELAKLVKLAIDEVNAPATTEDTITALQNKSLALENVTVKNAAIYAEELATLQEVAEFKFEEVADIQAFVNAANATPIGKLNAAKTTTAAKEALEALELDLAIYDTLSNTHKNLVAQQLGNKNLTGFATVEEIQDALDTAIMDLLNI